MAFIKQVVERFAAYDGTCTEIGNWTFTGGDTSGTLVPETFGQGINAGIRAITQVSINSDTPPNDPSYDLTVAGFSPRSRMLITSAANDTGMYTIKGRCA